MEKQNLLKELEETRQARNVFARKLQQYESTAESATNKHTARVKGKRR